MFTLCLQLQTARLSSEVRHTLTTERVDTIHTHTISTAAIVIVIVIIVKNKKELNITARISQCACTVQ